MKINSIIFDMDGVLVDSQPWHFEAERKIVESYGYKITDKELAQYLGWNEKSFWTAIKKKYHITDSVKKIAERKLPIYGEILNRKIKPDPYIKTVLQELKEAGLKIAVASSSDRKWVDIILISLGINELIEISVSGNEILRSKPFPDIFLEAARRLNTNPQNCAVIEDAPAGIKAAKSAGMFAIAIMTSINKELNFSYADKTIKKLDEIIDLIN